MIDHRERSNKEDNRKNQNEKINRNHIGKAANETAKSYIYKEKTARKIASTIYLYRIARILSYNC